MAFTGRDFILLLLCVCAAVNVLFYTIASPTSAGDKREPISFVDLQSDGGATDTIFDDIRSAQDHGPETKHLNMERRLGHQIRKSSRELQYATQDAKQQERTFNFHINNYETCIRNETTDNQHWDLVIVVISAVENFIRRQAIRNTWGSVLGKQNATLVYLLGISGDVSLGPQVEKEAELYNDIIQVDLKDSYHNLSLKSIAMLQWLNDYCSNSLYYLKTDDDMFVNVPNVIQELKRREEQRFFLCYVFQKAEPIRDTFSKWYVAPTEFQGKFYPDYCSGTAYTFSSNIILDLYKKASQLELFRMEDVFISGLAAQNLNITHIHHGGFSYLKREATGCAYENVLTGHEVTTKQMYIIYSQLQSKEIDCETTENRYLLKAEKEY